MSKNGAKFEEEFSVAPSDRSTPTSPGLSLAACLQSGHEALRQGNLTAAIQQYRQALEHSPDSPEVYQSLAEALSMQGDLAESAACYRHAIELITRSNPESNFESGPESNPESEARSTDSVPSAPVPSPPAPETVDIEQLDALLSQAESAAAAKQWQAVLTYCDQLLRLQPSAKTYKLQGNALQASGKSTEALTAYDKALQLQPDWAEVYANLGSLKAQQQQWQAAIDDYQRAIQLKPNFAGAYRNLARIWTQLNQPEKAAQCWAQAQALETATGEQNVVPDAVQPVTVQPDTLQPITVQPITVQPGIVQPDTIQSDRATLPAAAPENGAVTGGASGSLSQSNSPPMEFTAAATPPQTQPAVTHRLAQAQSTSLPGALSTTSPTASPTVSPTTAEQWIDQGTAYAEQGQLEKAIASYYQALQLHPKQAAAHWNLAEIWRMLHNPIAAADALFQSLQLEPTWATPAEHFSLGQTLAAQDRLDLAIVCYRYVADKAPNDSVFYALGEALSRKGQLSNAVQCYRRAIALQPSSTYYQALVQALLRLEDWQAVLDCYAQLTRIDSQNIQHYLRLTDTALQQGKPELALQVCRQAIEVQPHCWEAHHKLADLLSKQEQWSAAAESYRQAIALNPTFSWSHNNLGDALLHLQQWQAAAQAFEQAIALKPDFQWSHYNLGEALIELEQWAGAVSAYRNAILLNPDLPEIDRKLAAALKQYGSALLAESFQHYQRAISKDADQIDNYHQAIDLQPDRPELYAGLANALAKAGDLAGATVFRQMVEQLRDGGGVGIDRPQIVEQTQAEKKTASPSARPY